MTTRLSLFSLRVLEVGWLVAAFLVPLFFNFYGHQVFEPDKATLLRSLALIIGVAWVVWRVETGTGRALVASPLRWLRANPLSFLAILFLVWQGIATLTSVSPWVSFWGSYVRLQGLVTTSAYMIIFLVVAHFLQRKAQLQRLVAALILAGGLVSAYGLAQHLGWDFIPWSVAATDRVTSTMGNPIFMAAFLVITSPLTLAQLVAKGDQMRKGFSWSLIWVCLALTVALVTQLAAIIFTQSRGPWLGLLAAGFVMGLLFLKTTPKSRRRWRIASLSFLAALGAMSIFILLLNLPHGPFENIKGSSPYLERVGSLLDPEVETNRVRLLIWFGDSVGRGVMGLITASPRYLFLGYGPETLDLTFPLHYPPDLAHYEARRSIPDRSHNDYLDMVVNGGVVGLVIYIALLAVFFRQAWRAFVQSPVPQRLLIAGLLGGVVAHLVEVLTGIAVVATQTYFWLFLAMVAAMATWNHEDKEPTDLQERLVRPILFPLYLLVSLAAVASLALAHPVAAFSSPPLAVLGSFIWLSLGVLLLAATLRGPQRGGGFWRRPLLGATLAVGGLLFLIPILSVSVADIYAQLGRVYYDRGRPLGSALMYIKAARWAPHQDRYLLYLGRSLTEMAGRTSDAGLEAESLEASQLLSYEEGELRQLDRSGAFEAAAAALREAWRLSPLEADHPDNLGRLYRTWATETADPERKVAYLETASRYFQDAVRLSPNTAYLYIEWGLVYHIQGNLNEAMTKYKQALKLDPEYPLAYSYLGDIYFAWGNLDQSEAMYRGALRYAPGLVSAQRSLSLVLYRQGQLSLALVEAQKVVDLAPEDYEGHSILALLYGEAGLADQAISHGLKALQLAPPEQKGEWQIFLGQLQGRTP